MKKKILKIENNYEQSACEDINLVYDCSHGFLTLRWKTLPFSFVDRI